MSTASTNTPLAERIRLELKSRDWSQSQLAQASEIDASVLSRLLAGERSWRSEHVAGVAAALSLAPEALLEGTGVSFEDASVLYAEYVAAITKAHGKIDAENTHLKLALDAANQRVTQLQAENGRLVQQAADLDLARKRAERARAAAETELEASEERESALSQQVSLLKQELSALRFDLQNVQHQRNRAQEAHANASAVANKNYAAAKELERQLSAAKGFATFTGFTSLMLLLKTLDD